MSNLSDHNYHHISGYGQPRLPNLPNNTKYTDLADFLYLDRLANH